MHRGPSKRQHPSRRACHQMRTRAFVHAALHNRVSATELSALESKADVTAPNRIGLLRANSGHKPASRPAYVGGQSSLANFVLGRKVQFTDSRNLPSASQSSTANSTINALSIPPPYIACWTARKPITAMIDLYERRTAAVAATGHESPVIEVRTDPAVDELPPRVSPKTSSVR